MPIEVESLSKELLVAREIYRLNRETEGQAKFPDLVEALEERRLANERQISKALDILFDRGMVTAQWERSGDGNFVRVVSISGEAQEFVEQIDKRATG